VKLGGPQLKQAQRRGVASNKANFHKANNHHDRGNTEQFSTTRRKQPNVERSGLMNYLRARNDEFNNQARILIDSALADRLSEKPDERNSIQVRVYDLDDPRSAAIRSKVNPLRADGHSILLTLRQ
jgi:hypothetical protein